MAVPSSGPVAALPQMLNLTSGSPTSNMAAADRIRCSIGGDGNGGDSLNHAAPAWQYSALLSASGYEWEDCFALGFCRREGIPRGIHVQSLSVRRPHPR